MYGHQFCPENLKVSLQSRNITKIFLKQQEIELIFLFFLEQKLILSETSIFDVLPNFFYHSNQVVCMAALEVCWVNYHWKQVYELNFTFFTSCYYALTFL